MPMWSVRWRSSTPARPRIWVSESGNHLFNPNSLSNYGVVPSRTSAIRSNPVIPDLHTGLPACCLPSYQVVQDPSLATYGTLPRNYFRGLGYVNVDMAFSKTTAITERLKLEFRAEFFNIFNHTNFLNPGCDQAIIREPLSAAAAESTPNSDRCWANHFDL